LCAEAAKYSANPAKNIRADFSVVCVRLAADWVLTAALLDERRRRGIRKDGRPHSRNLEFSHQDVQRAIAREKELGTVEVVP